MSTPSLPLNSSALSKAWSPLVAALALVVPGAVAIGTHQLFLFMSLGPTAVTVAQQPQHPSSHPYNALVGHAVGFAAGCALVIAFGLSRVPSVFELHSVSLARASAAVCALALAAGLELIVRAQHPPAAATTLLVALGAFHPTWHDTVLVFGGLISVIIAGEAMRQCRLALARRASAHSVETAETAVPTSSQRRHT